MNLMMLTKEEREAVAFSELLQDIPIMTLNVFASIACRRTLATIGLIEEESGREKEGIDALEPLDNKRIGIMTEKIKRCIFSFYDRQVNAMSEIQRSSISTDVYDRLCDATDFIESLISIQIKRIKSALEDNVREYVEPFSPKIVSSIAESLYMTTVFINYRNSFREDIRNNDLFGFRKLNFFDDLCSLSNDLRLLNADFKEILFLYDDHEIKVWESYAKKKFFKQRKTSDIRAVDMRLLFKTETMDRIGYELSKTIFRYANIDKYLSVLYGGKDPRYREICSSECYLGSMGTYEQYVINIAILNGDHRKALEYYDKLKEKFGSENMLVCFRINKTPAVFHGIWRDADEAARELGQDKRVIVYGMNTNKSFAKNVECVADSTGLAYYSAEIFFDFVRTYI